MSSTDKLNVVLAMVDVVDEGNYIYSIEGTSKLIALSKRQAENLSRDAGARSITSVEVMNLSKTIATQIAEALLPLSADFGGGPQTAPNGSLKAPIATHPMPAKAAYKAPQGPQTAPQQPTTAPTQPPPPTPELSVDNTPEPQQASTEADDLAAELQEFGMDHLIGGGKRDGHPF
tara:strand:- start:227 stop:751 length:525 start_codon:yes stop_codon:yes gene_type:complete